MKIDLLEAFGVEERILQIWRESGHKELLPIQAVAVKKGKVLDGGRAIIASPTSSGKTFVGEMAAVCTARRGKRALYLVPQKALAEEKYQEFKARYASFGIRVVVSTRDRKQHDKDIRRGRFHIAVIVYEKLQALLVACPWLLNNVGLVVVDELQVIGDKSRGPGLEILLTKIKTSEGNPQIIGLSAVLGNDQKLAEWLGATLCKEERRPVELRKGVLWDGSFHYLEHNSGKQGKEKFTDDGVSGERKHVLVSHVKSLAEKNESCLIFRKSKPECVEFARAIAQTAKLPRAENALNELRHLEDSQGKDLLAHLLERGVAYHNADLDWDQRDVIERWFKRGEIKAICATSTLAMGINFPARNVFVDTDRWDRDRFGQWATIPLEQAEYENMCGRAGRLGLEKDYGRALIVAESEFDARTHFDTFVRGKIGQMEPTLDRVPVAQHALNLVASELCRSEKDIRLILLSSFTGEQRWKGGDREKAFAEELVQGIQHCLDGGLLEYNKKKELQATKLGRLTAAKGIRIDTAIAIAHFAKEHRELAAQISPFEILWCLTGTEDGESLHFNFATMEHQTGEYPTLLRKTCAAFSKDAQARLNEVVSRQGFTYEQAKRVKKTLILHDWINGIPTRDMETRFHCFSGSIAGLTAEYAWLADTFSSVAEIEKWPEEECRRLKVLADQMVHGVTSAGVNLTTARVRGFGRGRIMNLLAEGVDSLEKILNASVKQLEKLLSKPVATRVTKRVQEIFHADEVKPETNDELDVAIDDVADPLPAEWEEEYQPADDLGTVYQSQAMIELDGRQKDQRHLVTVNGKEAWLRAASFESMLKLAVAAKKTDLGWVQAQLLGEADGCHQNVRRLKQDLKAADDDAEKLIENNKAKHYRISVPASNIAIRYPMIQRHAPSMVRHLAPIDPAYAD